LLLESEVHGRPEPFGLDVGEVKFEGLGRDDREATTEYLARGSLLPAAAAIIKDSGVFADLLGWRPVQLVPGSLRSRLAHATGHALACGALEPIPTTLEVVPDRGVEFQIRVRMGAACESIPTAERPNPFLPYDADLLVAEQSETHLALLNKYPVVDGHMLVVTRAFEEQESYLTLADFEAVQACLAEIGGLGFYNSGRRSGASQRHKHLQLVGLSSVPMVPRLLQGNLPFRLAMRWLAGGAADCHARYRELLSGLGLDRGPVPAPYNLLLTSEWMLVVPRSRECFESISINALGFAGCLLVGSAAELELLRTRGPMTALESVAASGPEPPRG
jgi:sulfate adenylyltransferase (ADP) / ATP adenylyltransferase